MRLTWRASLAGRNFEKLRIQKLRIDVVSIQNVPDGGECRKKHFDSGAAFRFARDFNQPARLADDVLHGSQPHSGAFTSFLGGEKGLKQPGASSAFIPQPLSSTIRETAG